MLWTAAGSRAWSGDNEGTANKKQQHTLPSGFSKAEGWGSKVAPAASTASDCPRGPYPQTRASESASLSHSLGALQRGRSCTMGESARVPRKTISQFTTALDTIGKGPVGLPARCVRAHLPGVRLKGQGAQYEEEPFVPGEQPHVLSSLWMVPG